MSLMTLDEARKLLGEEVSTKLSDDELQQLIWDLTAIARETIKSITSGELKLPKE